LPIPEQADKLVATFLGLNGYLKFKRSALVKSRARNLSNEVGEVFLFVSVECQNQTFDLYAAKNEKSHPRPI
jgi:hypothetical protein